MRPSKFILTVIPFALGFVIGACDKDPEDDAIWDRCNTLEASRVACAEIAFEGCEDPPCYEVCTKRGNAAAEFSDQCGNLWMDFYECVADMTCEGLDQ